MCATVGPDVNAVTFTANTAANTPARTNATNYTFGIKEHIVFPEVNFDKVDKIRGLDITIVTKSKSKEGTIELLREFNFPLNIKKN